MSIQFANLVLTTAAMLSAAAIQSGHSAKYLGYIANSTRPISHIYRWDLLLPGEFGRNEPHRLSQRRKISLDDLSNGLKFHFEIIVDPDIPHPVVRLPSDRLSDEPAMDMSAYLAWQTSE